MAAKNRRRRARLAGAECRPYTLAQIAERDVYCCQLCGDLVDMKLSGLKPMGPTVDHIVPISRGGGDTPENVHLAHRRCNEEKGAYYDPRESRPLVIAV
ncbi:HNH endonuclease [Rhodococcus sp. 11-3]|uniref:HNH endonuclease n=1 Tax=Rhodococcus sp. 11-3 TaxID=2854796 RepID=UPI00203DDADB|nr:HNH endonuclease [Rhodococcus sp. 11-3]USC17022.1 HNH endonuclease [Rhodococcus sp. 11-3]